MFLQDRENCPVLLEAIETPVNQCLLASMTTISVASGSWGARLVKYASLQLARFTTVPAGVPAW